MDVKETFEAYGVETYVEMLGTNEAPGDWYPMWERQVRCKWAGST